MKTCKLQLAAMAASLVGAMSASAAIVNFDDLPTLFSGSDIANWGDVPASYDGLAWSGWEVLQADGGSGSYQSVYKNSYGAPSGPNFAYNGGDGFETITTGGQLFDFNGALVTSFAYDDQYTSYSSHNLTVEGYNGATLVGAVTVSLSPSSFVALPSTADFQNVTTVVFISDGTGEYWGLDNFSYTPVPEPTTMIAGALLLLPLGVSTLRILRRFRTA